MQSTTTYRATVEDFDRLDRETRVQLIDGVLLQEPAPTYRHQRAVIRLVMALGAFVRSHDGEVLCAPIDVELGVHDIFQPDVIFISEERRSIITEKRIVGAPDLVIEILSPGTSHYDLHIKKRVYESTGVREYWIVDPLLETLDILVNGDRGFDAVVRVAADEQVVSAVLPGLVLAPTSLFT